MNLLATNVISIDDSQWYLKIENYFDEKKKTTTPNWLCNLLKDGLVKQIFLLLLRPNDFFRGGTHCVKPIISITWHNDNANYMLQG